MQAGEEALAQGASASAAKLLERALLLQENQETVPLVSVRTRRLLAKALLAVGRIAESMRHSEEGLRRLGYPRSSSGLEGAKTTLISALTQLRFRLGIPSTSVVLLPEERVQLNEAYGLLAATGEASLYFGAETRLLQCALSCVNVADRTQDPEQQVFSYSAIAYTASVIPLKDIAQHYLDRAATALRRQPSYRSRIELHRLRSAVYINYGSWSAARRDATTAVTDSRSIDDAFSFMFCTQLRTWIALFQGDFPEAKQQADELVEAAERTQNHQFLAWGYAMRATIRVRLGDFVAAQQELVHADRHALAAQDTLAERLVLAASGLCAAKQGDFSTSRRAADAVLTLMRTNPILAFATIEPAFMVAEICLILLEQAPDVARKVMGQRLDWALDAQRRLARHLIIAKPRFLLCRGEAARISGEREVATRHFQRARELAERLEMPYEESRARASLTLLA